MKQIRVPFDPAEPWDLKAGDRVELTGVIFTARDAAHKRMYDTLLAGGKLPVEIANQVIYYAGPTPPRPGQVIGSAGPTTSGRMDKYTPLLLEHGLKGMIGKGRRSPEVLDAIVRYKAYYFAAVGGAGALIAKTIRSAEPVAYHDLGPEAIFRLEVERFPVFVVNDPDGGDLYREGVERYRAGE